MANSETLAQKIPNSKLVTIEGAGHVPTMTRPGQVVRAVDGFFS
jgi:pimeloyl-ACP methyl ester carboxylesterase